MAAILSSLIAVDMKFLATVWAFEIIDSLPLHLVKMAVPPSVAAFITTEAFSLLFCYLMNFPSAILAGGCFASKCCGWLILYVPVDIVPTAERLYRIQRDSKCLCNCAISVSGCA
jgi:hypothetical protein